MSNQIEITDSYAKSTKIAGLTVEVAEESLNRAAALLKDFPGGLYKAVGSALSRAAAAGRTQAKRVVTKQYAISSSRFLEYTKNVNHFNRSDSGQLSIEFGYAGYVIPLLKFDTAVDKDGVVRTRVLKSSSQEMLDRAFKAKMGAHTGVYERVGDGRFPVRELYGPSTPQMIATIAEAEESSGSQTTTEDSMENLMAETYSKRLDHEVEAILNGWRS